MSGSLPKGSLLPGENELAERFAVSRTTIRGALDGLVKDNLIETRTGIGSFVTFDGIALDQSSGWGRALTLGGAAVTTEICRLERITDPELAALVSADSMEFLAVDRVRRLSDGRAVSLERSRLPFIGRLAEAPEQALVDDSLTATIAASDLKPVRGEQWIAVSPLGAEDARLIDREEGALFLNTVRIAREADGRFVERVVSWLDPMRFRLHLSYGG